MPVPDKNARRDILQKICKGIKTSEGLDFDMLGSLTPGYVGADLQALVNEATLLAITRVFQPEHAQAVTEVESSAATAFAAAPAPVGVIGPGQLMLKHEGPTMAERTQSSDFLRAHQVLRSHSHPEHRFLPVRNSVSTHIRHSFFPPQLEQLLHTHAIYAVHTHYLSTPSPSLTIVSTPSTPIT